MSEERMSTGDLVFAYKETFHSKIDASSLLEVMVEKKWIKRKQKKTLDSRDDATRSSFLHSMFCNSVLAPQDFIDLVKQTKHEKNLEFAVHLQKTYDESRKHKQLQIVESKLTTSVEGQTLLQEQDSITEVVPERLPTETAISGSTFIHTDPTEPASAVFTSEGGILYSPYHGVSVHIPKGAIPEGQRVRISFCLVLDQESRSELLKHPDFPSTSILIGSVFDFVAKIVKEEENEGQEWDAFLCDVWISLPICVNLSPENSKYDYLSFAVYSEKDGQVERDTCAVFSFGYPYVNIPCSHFSKRTSVCDSYQIPQHRKRRRRYNQDVLCRSMNNLSLRTKSSMQVNSRPDSPLFNPRKLVAQYSDSPATKRALYREAKKVSSEASTSQEKELPQKNGTELSNKSSELANGLLEPEMMDTEEISEDSSIPSLILSLWLLQPKARHEKEKWDAKLCLLPHLPEAFMLMSQIIAVYRDEFSFQFLGFNWKSNFDCVCFNSRPSSCEAWDVTLSRHKILIHDVLCATEFLGGGLLQPDVLPKSVATVRNQGAKGSLHYGVTVDDSYPEATCFLTSDNAMSSQKLLLNSAGPEPMATAVEWQKDRYLFAFLSVVIPQRDLEKLASHLHCERIVVEQIESAHPLHHVGERIYDVFQRTHVPGKQSSFASIFTFLAGDTKYGILLNLARAYFLRFKKDPAVQVLKGPEYSTVFMKWILKELQMSPNKATPVTPLSEKEREVLFRDFALRIVSVWKIFARFFALEDSSIHSIAIQYSEHKPEEASYQMLLCLAQEFPSISYFNIHCALWILSLGTGAVSDALHFISHQSLLQSAHFI
jgi:hypothetical protein